MAIASAVQNGQFIRVCDATGRQLSSIHVGNGKLQGYTATTVSALINGFVHIYDEQGRQISSTYAPSR